MFKKIVAFFSDAKDPFVWAHVNPEWPHAGLAQFTEDKNPPWKPAIKIEGADLQFARIHFMGKVIAWERLSKGQQKALEGKEKYFVISAEEIKGVFR